TARSIYDKCNARLAEEGMTARGLMHRYGVEVVCTTDDPIDSLEYHEAIRHSDLEIRVLPAWRPDKAMAVGNRENYIAYLKQLSEVSGVEIMTYDDLLNALHKRHDFFASQGCKVADHGVCAFPWHECTSAEAETLFAKIIDGGDLSDVEIVKLQSAMLLDFARMNHAKGWVQQFHFGPMRNVNTRMFRKLGPDVGFDTIGDYRSAEAIAHFLDALDVDDRLAKTILYNINPADNAVMAAMIANFQDGTIPGKIQFGSGWWFNDQIDGMERQINALSLQGLLSRFVGMLTDSRSFVSYPRHDYFRRVLCNLIGQDVENGLIPMEEMSRIEAMVEDICYYNAKRYFGF
ncbi:MAG: glucuronate isomerase, partial [Muribaculaceae bacterium]|nr:glucuronate isomerase [Muribaculaceae bacterium]